MIERARHLHVEQVYHDPENGDIRLLEVNARISKSHSPLFEKVEGASQQEVMVDVGLGRPPEYPLKEGRYDVAAKFMLRHYGDDDDAVVAEAPRPDEVRALERRLPGTEIQLEVSAGERLGDLHLRDSYSYELAVLFMGAEDHAQLMRSYEECVDALHIRVAKQG